LVVKIAIIFLLCLPPIFGQQYNFIKYDVKDGIALSQIGPLEIYDNGKLLVTTTGGGINIYDGQEFNFFNSTHGLANNIIICLLKENESRIWLGTKKGLSIFNGLTFHNYFINDGLPSETIWGLVKSKDNTIWIGTDNGLAKYKNGIIETITDSLVNSKEIWSL